MTRRLTALLLLAPLALSACAARQGSATYKEISTAQGASALLEGVRVLNVHVAPPTEGEEIPEGGEAVLVGSFVSIGRAADALTDVTTEVADTTTLSVDGKDADKLVVPAGGRSSDTAVITLKGLTQALVPGTSITVELSFEKAGDVTLTVPVRAGDNGLSEREVSENAAPEE